MTMRTANAAAHPGSLAEHVHVHVFDDGNYAAERSTRLVMWITAAMMLVEIVAGAWFNSMALLADGWHMSSHAVAIGLTAFAYAAARRYARDPRFAFGTWKIEVLGGFASAIFLLGVAVMMVWTSLVHLIAPEPIKYRDAIVVAVLGLVVNVVCAVLLGAAHEHHHPNEPDHDHTHHRDLNLKSAYVHVVADAATSVLAIVALAGGWLYGWAWLDPAMGLFGALLVVRWAKNLLGETGTVLLDREMDHPVVREIREAIRAEHSEGERMITDLHVWRVGKNAYACALHLDTHDRMLTADRVRRWLAVHREIVHATIEINQIG